MRLATGPELRTRPFRGRGPRVAAFLATVAVVAGLPVVAAGSVSAAAVPTTIVSLTFDDGNANQYAAAQVLAANGMVGTFFITTSWIGSSGYLTRANLTSLAAAGHEIGGHSVTHPDLTTVSSATATAEICNGRTTLQSWGFTVTDFAYPFASRNSSVQRLVKNCGYTSARGLGDVRSPASCGSCPYAETIPPGNYFDTAAPDEVDSSWTLKNLQDLVTGAETHGGGWVQLTFHHIAVGTDPTLTISPTLFEQFVKWLAPRSANGTVVRTVAQALNGTAPPPTNQSPTASFTATTANLTATFIGAGSDTDGTVVGYSWNFGDGSTGTGKNPSHTYAAGGTYSVTLTVTDNQGATGTAGRQVAVNAPTTPTAPGVPTGVTATAGNGSATVSWTAPGDGGSALTAYVVTPYIGATAQTPVEVTGAPPAKTATVSGLTNGTAYTFRVAARNAVGTSTPSAPSGAVTPAAPPGVVVVNGGFESGLGSWTGSGVTAPVSANRGHSGSKSARLGVNSGREPLGDSSLSQTITVPATGTPTLSLWYQPHSDDRTCSGSNCRRDWMEGQLRSASGTTLATLFKLNNDRSTWTRVTADLSAYRGQQITLWFNVHLNGPNPTDNTWMFLDDVTVTS